MSNGKHVIFLGAGASVTSGFPTANDLRLLMGSPQHLRMHAAKALKARETPHLDTALSLFDTTVNPYRRRFEGALELFREGGFASMDAFCRLAQIRHPESVKALKRWMRLCLAVHNPEDVFAESDYYPFVERMFIQDTPHLRKDVALLSFNYDCYLEFLLWRAYRMRARSVGESPNESEERTAILSGMLGREVKPLIERPGFCLLKLHGSIAWPETRPQESNVSHKDLFGSNLQERVQKLCEDFGDSDSPILFPWETGIYGKPEDATPFPIDENPSTLGDWRHGAYNGSVTIEELFRAIWKRADDELRSATRISFCGLSFHPYLDGSFRYLLAACPSSADLELVFANGTLHAIQNDDRGKALLKRVDGLFRERPLRTFTRRIYPDFRSFIENEL